MNINRIAAAGAVAGLLFGAAAMAETAKPQTAPQTPQTWAPPAEIANKPAAPAPAPDATSGAPTASAETPAAAPMDKAEKEKDCLAQAKAKHLRKGQRRSFVEECMKQ